MVKVSDNRFVLCGSIGPDFNDSKTVRAGMWVVDSNGTVLQTWVGPESPDLIVIIGLLPASDGGFVAHGRIYLGEGPWGSRVQVCLMKFSPDLELEWLKPVGPTTSNYNGFMDMIQTPDGHYLAAGERTAYGLSGGDWGGWLFKFTEQGDSLWARADNAPPGYKATGEFVYGGVGLLSSGNIVAGGKGDVDDNFVGWVVKVTADGCLDTVLCGTSGVGEAVGDVKGLRVYPNPAREAVTVEFPNEITVKSLKLIRLADGRTVRSYDNFESNALKIHTAGLPAGLYAVIAGLSNGGLIQAKLLLIP